jgi:hypothetical protein
VDPDLFFKFFHFDLKFLFFPEAESQGFTQMKIYVTDL